MIYVGSLASFNFFPRNNSKGATARKKKKERKLTERDQVLSERKELREKGRKNFACIPQWRLLFQLWLVLHTLLSFLPSIYTYTFLNKASVKHLVTRRFESSDCQTALFLLSYLSEDLVIILGMMKRNRRIEDKPWSCLLILQPFLTLFLKYSYKEKEMDPFRKG